MALALVRQHDHKLAEPHADLLGEEVEREERRVADEVVRIHVWCVSSAAFFVSTSVIIVN